MEIISDDKLQASFDKNSILRTGSSSVTVILWPLPNVLHDFSAFADSVRDRAKRAVTMSAASCVFANINRPRIGVVNFDLELTALLRCSIGWFKKHPLAGLGSEEVRAEILNALVHFVEASHLRLLAKKANDGA